MKYYLDTEFDGFGGPLISLALIREDGKPFYLVYMHHWEIENEWVLTNVVPILLSVPPDLKINIVNDHHSGALLIGEYLKGDQDINIITDWPDDIAYFSKAVITGPGTMAPIPGYTIRLERVDAYPTRLPGAIEHNAYWDAMALRFLLEKAHG